MIKFERYVIKAELDLEFSWKFHFLDIFWINFADIEIKLGVMV
jgi:hypothetical protein